MARLPASVAVRLVRARALLARERLGVDGRAALEILRALGNESRWRPTDDGEQLVLGALLRCLPVADCPLGTAPAAVLCVSRQLADELQVGKGPAVKRSSRAKRGTASEFLTCRGCRVGAGVRRVLGDDEEAMERARRAPRAKDTTNS